MVDEKLKLCPFCGEEVELKAFKDTEAWYISHKNIKKCNVAMYAQAFDTYTRDEIYWEIKINVVENWNRRDGESKS